MSAKTPAAAALRQRRSAPDQPDGAARSPAVAQLVPPSVVATCAAAVRRMGESGLHEVAVTSTRRGEGRSTVALGTALVLRARPGTRAVIVELDLDRPALASALHLPPSPGVAEVLRGDADLLDSVVWLEPSLGVLHAGDVDGEAERLLALFETSDVVDRLTAAGLTVVGDLPPLFPHGLGDHAVVPFAATLLVVRARRTPLEEIRSAIRVLDRPPAVILNGASSAVPTWLRAFGL